MRKIIPYIIKLSAVLMVLSVIGQQVSATKGDVERALALLKQARAAIVGIDDWSVPESFINGKSSRKVQLRIKRRRVNGEVGDDMIRRTIDQDRELTWSARTIKLALSTSNGKDRSSRSKS